ncbi:hypothetical protein GlitD10_2039 [Gloeomargarita lithophora Alchichica-D10]|uniref:Nucleoside phosphorylase domain-containing protein n=1 Tax=Gloeomargarita lithophora Alchichica-D10 TaxID=1188229 RepID=A0A1J0AEL3_9CYAN|nr:hypothetical protein [Gloeomargarita lithophora]APB34365.1 hypothetical protein GlitD10_2039 [Gloeomargarita lithophora Alchichica-D10]
MVPPQTGTGFSRLTLVVPQGAEYQAVRRGANPTWSVVPIPLGSRALPQWWAAHQRELAGQAAILLGLSGGLQADFGVGTAVICQECTDAVTGTTRPYDPELTQWLVGRLNLPVVTGLTVPQIVTQPQEKQKLGQKFGCAVAEMEGYALLAHLPRLGCLRVVSDALHQTLPDVGTAVDETTGQLHPLPLAWAMLWQPGAAISLVHGALTGLGRLTALAQRLTANVEKNYNEVSATDVSGIQT